MPGGHHGSLSVFVRRVSFRHPKRFFYLQIVLVGLNHTTSSVAVRERAIFRTDELPGALDRAKSVYEESFLLSTCNRTEVYALVGHEQSGVEKLRQFISTERGIPADDLLENSYSFSRDGAVKHFFRVAAGLDSMALGETEILGQIRRALDQARHAGALGPLLGRLGAAGLRAGRDARAATKLGRNRVSLVSLACEEALARGTSLDGARVAVLGAGQTAESVIRYLRAISSAQVAVMSRSLDRAQALAGLYGADCHPWDKRNRAASEADVIFACTSAAHPILSAGDLELRRKPLLCIDLGFPRDIDADVRDMTDVALIDIGELELLAAANRLRRGGEVAEAELLVDRSVMRFTEWWRARQVVPTIAGIRTLAENIRDEELSRALSRLGDLDDAQLQHIRSMAHRIVGKLLHRPLTMLRHDAEDGNLAQVLCYLFQLDGAPPPGKGPEGIPCAHNPSTEPALAQDDVVHQV